MINDFKKHLFYGVAVWATSPGFGKLDQCNTQFVRSEQNRIVPTSTSPISKLNQWVNQSVTGHFPSPIAIRDADSSFGVAEAVAEIRSVLSLQIKELAGVLAVERPTIYAWLRGEAKPQSLNRKKLKLLLGIVGEWKKLSDAPVGASVRDDLDPDGQSLVDMLRQSDCNITTIRGKMERLSRGQTVQSNKKLGVREIALSLGIDISKVQWAAH